MSVSMTNGHIQVKIKMIKLSQKPLALTTAPNQDLKDIYGFHP